MKRNLLGRASAAAGVAATLACVNQASAQSADAILDKLVEKGILTQDEAKQLRDESDKGFRTAYQSKSGLADWVTSLKVNGDFRGRYESFQYMDNETQDRNRFRYRARFGLTALMWDNLEAGIRLTSSEPTDSFGGDPISGNTTFQNNGSKKFLYLDLAYAKWSPLNTYAFRDTVGIGKLENPFTFSDMVFDGDYTMEGAMNQFTYALNDLHALKLNAGLGVLDEIGAESDDPYFVGVQLQWDGVWLQKEGRKVIETSLAAGFLTIEHTDSLENAAVPNINLGNTRVGAAGDLAYHYNPIVADASLTYTLERFPMFSGFFPIKVAGEYMVNPAAPTRNTGWWAGLTLGKSGKRRTWELGYRYKVLEADAWYEEFVDSDFGAYWTATPATSARGSGYNAGTNVKGHILKAGYSPFDALTLNVTYLLTELVDKQGAGFDDSLAEPMGRLQVDAVLKF